MEILNEGLLSELLEAIGGELASLVGGVDLPPVNGFNRLVAGFWSLVSR